jgi:hypothetical protein
MAHSSNSIITGKFQLLENPVYLYLLSGSPSYGTHLRGTLLELSPCSRNEFDQIVFFSTAFTNRRRG